VRQQRTQSDLTPVKLNLGVASGTAVQGNPVTLDQMNTLLENMKDDLYTKLSAEINTCRAMLESSAQDMIKQQEQISSLISENAKLKARLRETELKHDELEQYGRRNTVEVHGIPQIEHEHIPDHIINIGKVLNVNLEYSSIDACHRLPKRKNQPTAAIVVRFVRRTDADALLTNRRACKNLQTNHINVQGNSTIYVNQSLTAKRRKVFAQARQILGDNGVRRLWIDRVGRVKVRSEDGKSIHVLRDEDDLSRIIPA
jgi:hypothetical protein